MSTILGRNLALSGASPEGNDREGAAADAVGTAGAATGEAPLSAFGVCPMDLTDLDADYFCPTCGRTFMPKRSASTAPVERLRGRGLTKGSVTR